MAGRLADARCRARTRAGRLSVAERQAITVASYAMFRTIRRQRRKKVEGEGRFPLRTVENPSDERSAEQKSAHLFASAPELLEEPPLPESPPAPEAESKGDGDAPPVPLPKSAEQWQEERARQAEAPFRAGKVKEVDLEFREGARPVSPIGYHLQWGPVLHLAALPAAQRQVVLKLLAKDVRSGALRFARWDEVDLITPIFVAFHPVTLKPRLVHDLRALNCRLKDSTVQLDRAADALCHGSYAAKLDLLQAFRHVRLRERDRRLLAFVVDGVPLRWEVLPFGASQSPELFAAALASTIGPLQGPGWRYIVYVDDILVVSDTVQGLDAATARLMVRLRGGGWYIALDKAYLYAMTVAPFLGVLVDLKENCLRVSPKKADRLRELCTIILKRRSVSLRDLQRIGGLLAFFAQAAPEAALGRVGINAATAEAEGLPGRTVGVKGELRDNLVFWERTASLLPSMHRPTPVEGAAHLAVASDAAGLPRLAFGGVVWDGAAPGVPDIDAALDEAAARQDEAKEGMVAFGGWAVSRPFPVDRYGSAGSAVLEVVGFHGVLAAYVQKRGVAAVRGRVVDWYCDAQVAVGSVGRWRARAPGLTEALVRLLQFTRAHRMTIVPHWVARSAGWQPLADALSKVRWQPDTAEWRLPQAIARDVMGWATFKPDIDLFATESMALLPRYVSRWPERGSSWCDAFARSWTGLRAYAFPPFSVAAAMLRHACGSKDLRLVVVVPRSTAVPARLRVVWRRALDAPRLVDVTGHQAPCQCPVLLDAMEVRTEAHGGAS